MSVIGITCARGGSRGVKRKNVRELCGKPLIAWTIEEAQKATLLDDYVICTDDDEIKAIARSYDVTVIDEPPELAGDNIPIIDAINYALGTVGDYKAVADLRTTNPLKTALDIDGAVNKLLQNEHDTDGVVGVTQLEDHHPSRIKRIVADRLVDFWPEPESGLRQDLHPKAYIRNGSIYVFWTELLQYGIYFIGPEDIRPWVMPEERSVNIDTELDWMLAEALLNEKMQG
jgi:CMP-N-acetylneuraminic acid synthetase